MPEPEKKTAIKSPVEPQLKKPVRRPYEPPRVTVSDVAKSILGPAISPTADGASGSFRP